MQNNKNILLATLLSMVILLGWTWFYEKPRAEQKEIARKIALQQQELAKENASKNVATNSSQDSRPIENKGLSAENIEVKNAVLALKNRDEILAQSKNERIEIKSENLHGSLNLKGARFDDLTLAKYFVENDKKDEVVLFAPASSNQRYFADFGFVSSDANLDLPNPETLWKSSSGELSVQNPITLSWKNKQGIEFFIDIALDKNFMFEVKQRVVNNSNKDITLAAYGRINRVLNLVQKPVYILHEGPIGVFDGVLQEVSYKDMTKEKSKNFASKSGGWLGITDKYWLSSIVPDNSLNYQANFSYNLNNQNQIFNSEFVSQEFKILKGENLKFDHHFFAGAKQVKLLDQYAKDLNIPLFDRAIDFGWFYFLTKPFFSAIAFLNKFLGNFGLAILAMTVIIKLLLLPMANKSYAAIGKMKQLQPKIQQIRDNFKGDKIALNREIMELYKREKINPASGCLPLLVQIPIFFSLYKVIFVTLDMRHAPFYGWINDLSAPDPTSVFNLFGLLPFEVSGILAIGIWPILMGLTMILQQKLSPQATDPTQAKVLKFMPYILTFVLAAFPAGLVIYWTWNNLLSIAQQYYIMKKVAKV